MTGGAFIPTAGDEEYDLDADGQERHAVQWVGTPGVKGPKWARMPLLTVGMLGIQCVWSIEMGYASPYLLELGLSKSWMSLVFVAGPLSGLIVQPLIGIFADRSRSPMGRRRPFMLAGCAISVFAMMLLGWTREVSGIFGGGSPLAIGLAVWAIYLIDFSINAVMSTDRALVVDTLPPSLQEEGSAWAGRMFGFGSVAGFFVGNLDLPPVLPFLGKTQLQILSFITSSILIVTHTFTSWGVTERVLLRDDRPQTQSSLRSNLRAIWDNMFSLPMGIKTVCIIQFCASLGWFPVLFFTTVWVSEIYKTSTPSNGMDEATIASEAVRTGARALLLNSLVNIVTSIGLPFLVSESGVQPTQEHTYTSLNGGMESSAYLSASNSGHGLDDQPPNSAMWKRAKEEVESGGFVIKSLAWLKRVIGNLSDGTVWRLPIKGLTLVRVWWVSQFVFAGAMGATWFVKSVYGAYLVIAVTGFCWAVAQWAPYSLLGELILLDNVPSRTQLQPIRSRPSGDVRISLDPHRSSSPVPEIYPDISTVLTSSTPEPSPQLHSRHSSRSNVKEFRDSEEKEVEAEKRMSIEQDLLDPPRRSLSRKASRNSATISPSSGPSRNITPLIIPNTSPNLNTEVGDTVVLRHSDQLSSDEGEEDDDDASIEGLTRESMYDPSSPRSQGFDSNASPTTSGSRGTADKAGVILGIHNVFLVLPQFIVTFLSSIIFYLLEPEKTLPTDTHTSGGVVSNPITNGTVGSLGGGGDLVTRDAGGIGGGGGSPDAVGLIFRIGGVSAAVGGYICWRMSRNWARGRGI